MDDIDRAFALKKVMGGSPKTVNKSSQTTTIYATAMSNSINGQVMADFGGDVISGDNSAYVSIPTTFYCKAGDRLLVQLVGEEGKAKSPTVIGIIGRGDEQNTYIEDVDEKSDEAFKTATDYIYEDTTGGLVIGNLKNNQTDHSAFGRGSVSLVAPKSNVGSSFYINGAKVPRMWSGSSIVNPNGNNWVTIGLAKEMTKNQADIIDELGIPTVIGCNGDERVTSVKVIGFNLHPKDNGLHVVAQLSDNYSGAIRINWTIIEATV